MEADDTLLTQLMIDLGMWHTYARVSSGIKSNIAPEHSMTLKVDELPIQDPLSTGIHRLREDEMVSTWFVFAAKLFHDIHDILGQATRQGWDDLCEHASIAKDNLQVEQHPSGALDTKGERWVTKDIDVVMKIYQKTNLLNHNPYQTLKDQ